MLTNLLAEKMPLQPSPERVGGGEVTVGRGEGYEPVRVDDLESDVHRRGRRRDHARQKEGRVLVGHDYRGVLGERRHQDLGFADVGLDEAHPGRQAASIPFGRGGIQGGPLMHVIAAKAIALKEALEPGFRDYQEQVIRNAKVMAEVLMERGYPIISGGTENHLMLVSLIEKGITGKDADAALGRAYITVNKNSVPNDPQSPFVTSGLRLGTPAITTRGFGEAETRQLTGWIADILDDLENEETIDNVRTQVLELCARFPVYG